MVTSTREPEGSSAPTPAIQVKCEANERRRGAARRLTRLALRTLDDISILLEVDGPSSFLSLGRFHVELKDAIGLVDERMSLRSVSGALGLIPYGGNREMVVIPPSCWPPSSHRRSSWKTHRRGPEIRNRSGAAS